MNSGGAWRDKYRPQSFREVVGQRRTVDRLTALVHPRAGRNVILSGKSGSGKTTLAYAFAKAAMCFQPDEDGEPCRHCDSCREWEDGNVGAIFEVDCPRHGTRDEVEEVLGYLSAAPLFKRSHVVFFDEAHDLSRAARDMLLKALEKPRENVVFIFALLDAGSLPVQIRDRCRIFELDPPTKAERAEFLDRMVQAEELVCTPAAHGLLVQHSSSFRALAGNLEALASEAAAAGTAIDDALVKSLLMRGGPSSVLDYLQAVVLGDLGAQFKHMRAVRLSPDRRVRTLRDILLNLKLRWIGPVLASGVEVPFEGLLDEATCGRIAQGLSERADWLGIPVTSLFDQILDFWSFWPSGVSDEELEVQMVRFHDRLAFGADPLGVHAEPAEAAQLRKAKPISSTRPRLRQSLAIIGRDKRDDFLSSQQVQEIYEAATFMIQRYGLCFNTFVELDEGTIGCSEAQGYVHQTSEFLRELGQNIGRWAKSESLPDAQREFHRISLHERNAQGMLCTRIVFHSPQELAPRIEQWFGQYLIRKGSVRPAKSAAFERDDSRKAAGRIDRHWKLVRELWRGTDPAYIIDGAALIELLGVPPSKRRPAGDVGGRRFAIGRSLSLVSQTEEARDHAPHLSPFRDQAWDWLFRGWERQVHQEREARRDAHHKALAELDEDMRGMADSLSLQKLALQRDTLIQKYHEFRCIRKYPWQKSTA